MRRLASTILLWAIVLWTIFSPHHAVTNWMLLAIMLALAWFGLREFYGLIERRGLACYPRVGLIAGVAFIALGFLHLVGMIPMPGNDAAASAAEFDMSLVACWVLALLVRRFLDHDLTRGLLPIATTLLGLLYVPWLLNFITRMAFHPGVEGRYYVLYFILVTKFSDLGAYVTGSLLGRHKMIPRISPGKTWEGFAGAVAISTGVSLLFAGALGHRLAGMTLVHAAVLGVLLSIAAVLGDLIESLFKREAGAKDSGRVLPGIGGILDLLDSLLFNAPLMYLYLRHILAP